MVKFIHTSDWHLGMQAHFLPDEARARFAQDRFDAVKRIAAIAAEEECGFVVVAGDVFDSNHVDPRVVARGLDALASFTVPVFLLPGNHDPLDASSIYRSDAWSRGKPDLVAVVEELTAIPVPGLEDVEVVGCPWRTKHQIGDPAAECYAVASPNDGALRVAVAHGVVDELSPEADNPALVDAAGMRKAIEAGRVQYVALGDRHSATGIEDTDARAWYSGAPVATDHGEVEPNQVLLVELGPDSCAVESRAVGAWSFQRHSLDLNGEGDVEALAQLLDEIPEKPTAVVRLTLRGTLSLAANSRREEVLEVNGLRFASLNTWEKQDELAVAPDEEDLAALDVSGYGREALDQLSEEAAGGGEEAVVARDSLNLLYRLAR